MAYYCYQAFRRDAGAWECPQLSSDVVAIGANVVRTNIEIGTYLFGNEECVARLAFYTFRLHHK